MSKSFYTLLFAGLLIMGCKKYPEGGYYKNASKIFSSREGSNWDLIKYEVNGIDSTNFIVSNSDPKMMQSYVRFFKYEYYHYYDTKGLPPFEINYEGNQLICDGGRGGYDKVSPEGVRMREVLTPNGRMMRWEIMKCKKGEIILASITGHYRVILKER